MAGVVLDDGAVHWFAKLRKGRHRRALTALLRDPRARLPEPLDDREVEKRRGRLRD